MGVDWEYLRGVTGDAGEWREADLEELYQVRYHCNFCLEERWKLKSEYISFHYITVAFLLLSLDSCS